MSLIAGQRGGGGELDAVGDIPYPFRVMPSEKATKHHPNGCVLKQLAIIKALSLFSNRKNLLKLRTKYLIASEKLGGHSAFRMFPAPTLSPRRPRRDHSRRAKSNETGK